MPTMIPSLLLVVVALCLLDLVSGFAVVRPLTTRGSTPTSLNYFGSPLTFLAEGEEAASDAVAVAAKAALDASNVDTGGIFSILQTVAVVITAGLFLLAGLTVLTANMIIPEAAKELEKECLELAPDLWAEYQAKLDEGQTIANRPDLMQELGNKLQPLLDAKLAKLEAEGKVEITDLPFGIGKAVDYFEPKEEDKQAAVDVQNSFMKTPKTPVEEDDSWSSSPMLDLSALTDQIEVPTSSSDDVVDAEVVTDEDEQEPKK